MVFGPNSAKAVYPTWFGETDSSHPITTTSVASSGIFIGSSLPGYLRTNLSVDYTTSWVNAKDPAYATLQAAIDTHCNVFMPPGTFTCSAPITGTTNNQVIQGSGAGTRIISSHLTNDIIQMGNNSDIIRNAVLRDFTIWASVTKTLGSAINLRKPSNCTVEGVWAGTQEDWTANGNRLYDGISVTAYDQSVLSGFRLWGCAHDGIVASDGAGLFIQGGFRIVGAGQKGIHFRGSAGGICIDEGDVSTSGEWALVLDTSATGVENREIFCGDSLTLDSSIGGGAYFDNNSFIHAHMIGTWISSNGSNGLQVTAAQVGEVILQLDGVKLIYNHSHGAAISGGSFMMNGCLIRGNGTTTGGYGVAVIGNIGASFSIHGSHIKDNGIASAGGGVFIDSGNDNFSVQNNIIIGNLQGNISNNSGTGATKLVQNNVAP